MTKAKRTRVPRPAFRIEWYDLIRDIEEATAMIEKYAENQEYTDDDLCNLDELRGVALRLAREIETVFDCLRGAKSSR